MGAGVAGEWKECLSTRVRALYQETYEKLDKLAQKNPHVVRVPANASPKVAERLRKNYALDRSRYFIPFATKTNVALVMTARGWADTIS